MVRTKQGGSVLSFVVIGVLLLAVFAGGAYIVRQYMQPSREMPTELPGERLSQTPQSEEKTPEQSAPEDGSDKPPREEEAKTREEKSQSDTLNRVSPRSEKSGNVKGAVLPETGPSQLFASLLVMGLISAVAVSYLRSRRPSLSL